MEHTIMTFEEEFESKLKKANETFWKGINKKPQEYLNYRRSIRSVEELQNKSRSSKDFERLEVIYKKYMQEFEEYKTKIFLEEYKDTIVNWMIELDKLLQLKIL